MNWLKYMWSTVIAEEEKTKCLREEFKKRAHGS